jgi:hypothetical protein
MGTHTESFEGDVTYGAESARFRERSRAVLLLGRERVRDVLEPHLGKACALERANNIAQALALEEAQPDDVAFEMLRKLPGEERKKLAAAVRREWLAVEFDQFRARRAQRRCALAPESGRSGPGAA